MEREKGEVAEGAKYGIATSAFSALIPLTVATGGPVDAVVREIGEKHGITPTQVLLLWAMQMTDGPLVT